MESKLYCVAVSWKRLTKGIPPANFILPKQRLFVIPDNALLGQHLSIAHGKASTRVEASILELATHPAVSRSLAMTTVPLLVS